MDSKGNIQTGCLVECPNNAAPPSNPDPFDFVGKTGTGKAPVGYFTWEIPWKFHIIGGGEDQKKHLLM
jgi:hypothetical protein